ncbi:MAG: hypothetical protein ABI685_08380 [Ferruginibacter sp.]
MVFFLRSFSKIIMLLFCIVPQLLNAQNKSITCADLRTGFYHSYPASTNEHYLYIRDSLYQTEIETVKGDTTLWKITWLNDCSYTLKFVSGKMNKDMVEFLKNHVVLIMVNKITDSYFTFSFYFDKVSDNMILADTMWLTEKTNFFSNTALQVIKTDIVPPKKHFNDTSAYALVFVYRPGKVTNSLGNYIIYFNDYGICVAKNNSGYIYKVYKEGQLELKSMLYKDVSAVNVNIKFGQKYYVKSMIHWTITSRLNNFKLEMKLMDPKEGESEFEEVRLQ